MKWSYQKNKKNIKKERENCVGKSGEKILKVLHKVEKKGDPKVKS